MANERIADFFGSQAEEYALSFSCVALLYSITLVSIAHIVQGCDATMMPIEHSARSKRILNQQYTLTKPNYLRC